MHGITLEAIREAARRIEPYAHRTPVMRTRHFDELLAAERHFKCENFQKVGAFKFRGARNAVFSLSDDQAQRGVVTHSSGNHGQAVAMAAEVRGTRAVVVMPENAAAIKREAVAGYGADIVTCGHQ